jgi:hypothetical protein
MMATRFGFGAAMSIVSSCFGARRHAIRPPPRVRLPEIRTRQR